MVKTKFQQKAAQCKRLLSLWITRRFGHILTLQAERLYSPLEQVEMEKPYRSTKVHTLKIKIQQKEKCKKFANARIMLQKLERLGSTNFFGALNCEGVVTM